MAQSGHTELHRTCPPSGVKRTIDRQFIDTTTPTGKLMFQIVGAFAEFERSMIRERVHAGLKRAVANGKTLGRPPAAWLRPHAEMFQDYSGVKTIDSFVRVAETADLAERIKRLEQVADNS